MPRAPPSSFIIVSMIALFILYVVWTRDHERPMSGLSHAERFHLGQTSDSTTPNIEVAQGPVIMSKLGNETLKEELGRAAWKLFHTTMARFPDKPSTEESEALQTYIHLFARLYPCGECAEHFQKILKKYPPQTSSRSSAAAWACFVHNEVNESKGKPIFDCNNIGDFYHCGCAEDDATDATKKDGSNDTRSSLVKHETVEIEREGPTRGG